MESQNVCKQKNKKREFKVTYGSPEKTDDGFKLSIEVILSLINHMFIHCLLAEK